MERIFIMLVNGGFELVLKFIMRYISTSPVRVFSDYSQIEDFEKLGEVLLMVCRDISKTEAIHARNDTVRWWRVTGAHFASRVRCNLNPRRE